MKNNQELGGNLDGIRQSILTQIEALYNLEIPRGEFCPPELAQRMAELTGQIRREIAVMLRRDGSVAQVTVGQSDRVDLVPVRARRGGGLSGLRLIHTHPGSSGQLSDVDLNALASLRMDCVAAIGEREGKAVDFYAAYLSETPNQPLIAGPFHPLNLPQDALYAQILECEQISRNQAPQMENEPERVVLVGIERSDNGARLEELARLAETAGAQVIGSEVQRKRQVDTATYIGSGKVEELSLTLQGMGADLAIFDDELSGAQVRNLEERLGCRVIDRTMLILDIFAGRATSREGKLQVELAQYKYRLPRLAGLGTSLSRLGGGIGTRGPGESKLESDRRHIRRRIRDLEQEIERLAGQRGVRRARRERDGVPVVALVGYTNAGKSTLLNALCGTDQLAEDKLFATLDTVSRRLELPVGECLLVDTVGFIEKLPHDLVDAFRSTLEETIHADLLLHVVDASSLEAQRQMRVVEEVLGELGAGGHPLLLVLNKMDRAQEAPLPAQDGQIAIRISARQGDGLEELRETIAKQLTGLRHTQEFMVPYTQGDVLSFIHANAQVEQTEHTGEGTQVTVTAQTPILQRISRMLGIEQDDEEQPE